MGQPFISRPSPKDHPKRNLLVFKLAHIRKRSAGFESPALSEAKAGEIGYKVSSTVCSAVLKIPGNRPKHVVTVHKNFLVDSIVSGLGL